MLLIIFIVVSSSWKILADNFADLAFSAVVFLATMLLLCYAGTVLFGLDSATRFTIITEVTIHNIVLVALIATTILNRPELALMSIVVQIPLALGLLVWVFYRKARIAGLPSVAPPPFAPRET
jgi:predicted Na+-dependent transporter